MPQQPNQKAPTIEWPTIATAQYANNVLAQRDKGVLLLSFYQVNPPVAAGSDTSQLSESLQAEPVVRLAIPLASIPMLIESIRNQLALEAQSSVPGATQTAEGEDAEWEALEANALSTSRIDAIWDYIKSSGQASI